MKFSHLHLYPDLTKYSTEITGPFRDKTRCLCNFLERRVKPLNFETKGFSKLCVVGSAQPAASCVVNSSAALIAEVPFELDAYFATPADQLNEYFISMLRIGIDKATRAAPFPSAGLNAAVAEFRAGGYRNEWVYQRRLLKPIGVSAALSCVLDFDRFRLTLTLDRGQQRIFSQVILETVPDEIVFAPKFEDLHLADDRILVLDKFRKELFSMSVAGISTWS